MLVLAAALRAAHTLGATQVVASQHSACVGFSKGPQCKVNRIQQITGKPEGQRVQICWKMAGGLLQACSTRRCSSLATANPCSAEVSRAPTLTIKQATAGLRVVTATRTHRICA